MSDNLLTYFLVLFCLGLGMFCLKQQNHIRRLKLNQKEYFKLKTSFNEELQIRFKEQIAQLRQDSFNTKMSTIQNTISQLIKQYDITLKTVFSTSSCVQFLQVNNICDKTALSENFQRINEHTHQLLSRIKHFESLYDDTTSKEVFNVHEVLQEFLKIFKHYSKHYDINVSYEINKKDILLIGNQKEFLQLLLYILHNSKEALILKDLETKNIYIQLQANSKNISLVIKDNGGGIHESLLKTCFEPFISNKKENENQGLGLYSAYCIVQKLNGSISIENERFKEKGSEVIYEGAKCSILLPRYTAL